MWDETALRATSARWYQHASDWAYAPALDLGADPGDGPYHLIAVSPNSVTRSTAVRKTLEFFAGVDIPSRCPFTGAVITGQVRLHVVPQLAFTTIERRTHRAAGSRDRVASFAPGPPTGADLAGALVDFLSRGDPSASAGLGGAAQVACQRWGWRAVADLVNAMDEVTRKSPADVAAALTALGSEPARC